MRGQYVYRPCVRAAVSTDTTQHTRAIHGAIRIFSHFGGLESRIGAAESALHVTLERQGMGRDGAAPSPLGGATYSNAVGPGLRPTHTAHTPLLPLTVHTRNNPSNNPNYRDRGGREDTKHEGVKSSGPATPIVCDSEQRSVSYTGITRHDTHSPILRRP